MTSTRRGPRPAPPDPPPPEQVALPERTRPELDRAIAQRDAAAVQLQLAEERVGLLVRGMALALDVDPARVVGVKTDGEPRIEVQPAAG